MSASLTFVTDAGRLVLTDGDLNLSNSNAMALLSALGFDCRFEEAPAMAVEEFEQGLRLFRDSEIARYVDGGVPTKDSVLAGGARWIDCGRAEGYFANKVAMAQQLVTEAKGKGAVKCYFA
jgi:hypothetical protein